MVNMLSESREDPLARAHPLTELTEQPSLGEDHVLVLEDCSRRHLHGLQCCMYLGSVILFYTVDDSLMVNVGQQDVRICAYDMISLSQSTVYRSC